MSETVQREMTREELIAEWRKSRAEVERLRAELKNAMAQVLSLRAENERLRNPQLDESGVYTMSEVQRLTALVDARDAKIAELEARIAAAIKMIEDSPNGINGFLIRLRAYLLGGRGPYRPDTD